MENKYIEAFENIIFQKRDNGYISDAYRNDIDVVYEALEILEILKPRIYIEEGLYREDFQDDRLKFGKDFFDSVKQENTIKEWLDESNMKDYSTRYGSNTTVESFSETQKDGETYKIFVGDENPGSDHTSSKEYEKCIKETMEEYYDKCGIPEKYRNPNNIPGEIKIPTIIKNDLEKIKKIKGEKSMENNNNELLLQEQQNKAMEIIFNKCRDNVNLLLVNRNDTYDEYNSAFEYQIRTNVFDLKEEDKLTIDEFIDVYEWLKSERIKNGLEIVVEKEVDVTDVNDDK